MMGLIYMIATKYNINDYQNKDTKYYQTLTCDGINLVLG